MTRVVPSQVVELIEQTWPTAADNMIVHSADGGPISGVVQLVSEIPSELITLSGKDYSEFITSIQALTYALDRWLHRGGDEPPRSINRKSPIVVIRDLLKRCPDQRPSSSTAELTFINDADYRENVRNDISSAFNSFHNGEWKGATVLAGSAIEAMLLWAITNSGRLASISPQPKGIPQEWTLGTYIDLADKLNLIDKDTVIQTRQAQDFRNLIHPGRAIRLNSKCDRGTSLAALAAVEFVIRDLS
jgi:hypothetical protein